MSRAKRSAAWIARQLNRVFGNRAGDRNGILLYHRVQNWIAGVPEAPFNVRPDIFHDQLSGLLRRGYQFQPLQSWLRSRETNAVIPPRTAVLTFDDGFESVYRFAWPVLRELQIPATLFLASAYLDSTDPFPFDDWGICYRDQVPSEFVRPLTTAQCQEMAATGLIELAAHTHTHQDFRNRPAELREDLRTCVATLHSQFGCEQPTFAFPYGRRHLGYAGGVMSQAARATGVRCALTTDCELVHPHRDDPFSWGRFNVYDHDTSATLAAKLDGWYGWAPRLQVKLDRLRGRAAGSDASARASKTQLLPTA